MRKFRRQMEQKKVFRLFPPALALKPVLRWSLLLAVYSGLAVWKEHGPFEEYADIATGL